MLPESIHTVSVPILGIPSPVATQSTIDYMAGVSGAAPHLCAVPFKKQDYEQKQNGKA